MQIFVSKHKQKLLIFVSKHKENSQLRVGYCFYSRKLLKNKIGQMVFGDFFGLLFAKVIQNKNITYSYYAY